MNYRYLALDEERRLVRGVLEAANDRVAEDRLEQVGLKAISIKATNNHAWLRRLLPVTSTVSRKDVMLFSQQLATILRAGVPLLSGIQLLRNEARNEAFRTVLGNLAADLQEGDSIHDALKKFPKAFSQVYVRMVEAGNRSGTLDVVFLHLAAYLRRDMALRGQLTKALTYPAIVGVVGLVVMGILVTVVLPSLAELLSGLGSQPPLLTRLILGFSNMIQVFKLQLLFFIAGSTGFLAWYLRKPVGRRALARLLLNTPLVGRITLQQNLALFSRVSSLLLGAGLSITESLALAQEVSSNRIFREAIGLARSKVMEGDSLEQGLRCIPHISGLFVQMVKVGEETGTLESNLASMADFYEREVESQLATMIGLLEPAMTLLLGGAVAIIALSVLLPMFDLLDNIGVQP